MRFSRHPDFEVEKDNIVLDLPLTPWEAVLGAEITIPTLEGRLSIRIPPGSQTGQRLRLRGKGLGKPGARGDLYATLRVQTPVRLDEEERRLWHQLAARSRFQPRD